MSNRILTSKQIKDLLKNPNVIKCSPKSIGYSQEFKILAVNQYEENGLPAKEIFRQAELDPDIIGQETPRGCLKRWRRVNKIKGPNGLKNDNRGNAVGCGKGRPRIKDLTDEEKIKRLEATVAYLKAENDFLAKLRSGKAE